MGWTQWFRFLSLGSTAGLLVSALESRNSEQFSVALLTLLHDVGAVGHIKEIGDSLLTDVQPDISSLTAKIFKRIGPA